MLDNLLTSACPPLPELRAAAIKEAWRWLQAVSRLESVESIERFVGEDREAWLAAFDEHESGADLTDVFMRPLERLVARVAAEVPA